MPRHIASPISDSLNLELEEIALDAHPSSVDKRRRGGTNDSLEVPLRSSKRGTKSPSPLFEVMSPMSQIVESGNNKCKRKGRNSISPVAQRPSARMSEASSKKLTTDLNKIMINDTSRTFLLEDFADELLCISTSPKPTNSKSQHPTSSLASSISSSSSVFATLSRSSSSTTAAANTNNSFPSISSCHSPSCSSVVTASSHTSFATTTATFRSHNSRSTRSSPRLNALIANKTSSPSSSHSINQSLNSSISSSNSQKRTSPRFLPRPPSSLPSDTLPSRLRRTLPRKKLTTEHSSSNNSLHNLDMTTNTQQEPLKISRNSVSSKSPRIANSRTKTNNSLVVMDAFSPILPPPSSSTSLLLPPLASRLASSSSPSSPIYCANITIPPRARPHNRSRSNLNTSNASNISLDNSLNSSVDGASFSSIKEEKELIVSADWTLPITPTNTPHIGTTPLRDSFPRPLSSASCSSRPPLSSSSSSSSSSSPAAPISSRPAVTTSLTSFASAISTKSASSSSSSVAAAANASSSSSSNVSASSASSQRSHVSASTPAVSSLSPILNESKKSSLGEHRGKNYPVPCFSPSTSEIVTGTSVYDQYEASVSLHTLSGSKDENLSKQSSSKTHITSNKKSTKKKQINSPSFTPAVNNVASMMVLSDDESFVSSSSSSDSLSMSDSENDGVSTSQSDDVSFEWFPIASAVTKCAKKTHMPDNLIPPTIGVNKLLVSPSPSAKPPKAAPPPPTSDRILRSKPATIREDDKEELPTPLKSGRRSLLTSQNVGELSDDEEGVLIDEDEEDTKTPQAAANAQPVASFPFVPIPGLTIPSEDAPKCLRYQISVQVRNVPRGKTKPNPRVAVFESVDRQSVKLTETQIMKSTTDPCFSGPIVLSQSLGKFLLFRLYDVQKSNTEVTIASAVILWERLLASDGPMSVSMSLISGAKEAGPELVLQVISTANTLTQPLNWYQEVKVPSAQALERMAQGFVVTFHVDKKKPKKLYMRWKDGSHDGGLYWAQPGSQKTSGNLLITEILTVLRGKHTPGLRQDSAFRMLEQQCISIVCPLRTLELSFETRFDCDVVYSGLLALVHRLSPHRRELFLRGRQLPTPHCAVVIFDTSRDQRMKIGETEGQSGSNPVFSKSLVLSCCDRSLSLSLYAKESVKSDRLGNLIGSVKVNMAELAALETAAPVSYEEYATKRLSGRELAFELAMEGSKQVQPSPPILAVRVAPLLHAVSLHQGPASPEECLELMHRGQQFTKFGYLTGKAASRFIFYEGGEMGGMLFWCNGPDRVLNLDHSIRICHIVDVRVGNGSTPTFSKDEARNAREDLSFSILTTSRSVDLETPFTYVRNAFVHGLRHLLSLPASELATGMLAKGTLSKRTLLATLKTLPKANAANRKFSL